MKLKEGDLFLVTGPAHFEKAKIIKAEKGVYTLNNQMKIDRDLKVIGNSKFIVSQFDQDKYDYLLAVNQIPRKLTQIKELLNKGLSREHSILINRKLTKLLDRVCSTSGIK